MACNNQCGHTHDGCGTTCSNGGQLVILVLYILLAILIGSHLYY